MACYETRRRKGRRIGRNDPCPCNIGKKVKRCCGLRFKPPDGTGRIKRRKLSRAAREVRAGWVRPKSQTT